MLDDMLDDMLERSLETTEERHSPISWQSLMSIS